MDKSLMQLCNRILKGEDPQYHIVDKGSDILCPGGMSFVICQNIETKKYYKFNYNRIIRHYPVYGSEFADIEAACEKCYFIEIEPDFKNKETK